MSRDARCDGCRVMNSDSACGAYPSCHLFFSCHLSCRPSFSSCLSCPTTHVHPARYRSADSRTQQTPHTRSAPQRTDLLVLLFLVLATFGSILARRIVLDICRGNHRHLRGRRHISCHRRRRANLYHRLSLLCWCVRSWLSTLSVSRPVPLLALLGHRLVRLAYRGGGRRRRRSGLLF
jgi:hypothetical protein